MSAGHDSRAERAAAFLRDLAELTRRHRVVLASWCDEPALYDADTAEIVALYGLDNVSYEGRLDDTWRTGPVISDIVLCRKDA